jgi:predicted MFS family arabinose efflux permease
VLCIEARLLAFSTNRIDRRVLLCSSMVLYALGHAVSGRVTNFPSLLLVRLVMIALAAVFTPQAAAAVPASVALNTSAIYVGQATGTLLGSRMLTLGHAHMLGLLGAALVCGALIASLAAGLRFRV